jgi:hypothetical protein
MKRAQLEVVLKPQRDGVAGFDDGADRVEAIGEYLSRLVLAQPYSIRSGPVDGICRAKLIRPRKELEMVEQRRGEVEPFGFAADNGGDLVGRGFV